MGVDVASFGDPFAEASGAKALTYEDPFGGVYKKLVFNPEGTRLLGGVLVGDASDFGSLLGLFKSGKPITVPPGELLSAGHRAACSGDLDAQVCSCNNVSERQIRAAVRDQKLATVAQVKTCTQAGTGCGGCLPRVTDLLKAELQAMGAQVDSRLCEHFPLSRAGALSGRDDSRDQDVRRLDRFARPRARAARSASRPSPRSWRASGMRTSSTRSTRRLQDTNDRFLANIQRGGTYSVVPRVPGGEITPEKLIVLGEVARKYGLYTKITGGQRVDLLRCASAPPPRDLVRVDRGGVRERPRLRQGLADGEELRWLGMVPVRRSGLGRVRHPGRAAIPRAPFSSQVEGSRLRVRPRVRRGPEQGLRTDRHREGVQPLRLRKRRRKASARRSPRRRPRRGHRAPLSRPFPHVLHPHGRPLDPDFGLAREHGRRDRVPYRRDCPRPPRHRGRARTTDAVTR